MDIILLILYVLQGQNAHIVSLSFKDLHTAEETEGRRACVLMRSKTLGAREGIHFGWPQPLQHTEDENDDTMWLEERGSSLEQPLGDSDWKLTTNN